MSNIAEPSKKIEKKTATTPTPNPNPNSNSTPNPNQIQVVCFFINLTQ